MNFNVLSVFQFLKSSKKLKKFENLSHWNYLFLLKNHKYGYDIENKFNKHFEVARPCSHWKIKKIHLWKFYIFNTFNICSVKKYIGLFYYYLKEKVKQVQLV